MQNKTFFYKSLSEDINVRKFAKLFEYYGNGRYGLGGDDFALGPCIMHFVQDCIPEPRRTLTRFDLTPRLSC